MKTIISYLPFEDANPTTHWDRGSWPCRWISHPAAPLPPLVTAYKREFLLPGKASVRIHVSADERYELFLDGERVGRGPERGAPHWWYFETYDLDLEKGNHVIVARVWSLGGKMAPTAQMSVAPGFLLAPEGEEFLKLLGTGIAPWEALVFDGFAYTPGILSFGVGYNVDMDGSRFPWGWERGDCGGWVPASPGETAKSGYYANLCKDSHLLYPGTLPAMLDIPRRIGAVRHASPVEGLDTRPLSVLAAKSDADMVNRWQCLLAGESPAHVPPQTTLRVIIDLEDYYCAYPQVITSGGKGALVRLHWAESLFNAPDAKSDYRKQTDSKGNRNEIEGKFFIGVGDVFRPDGGGRREFQPLWWMSGRYLEIVVQTGDEPMDIEGLNFFETRYPLEMESRFQLENHALEGCLPIMVRAMQMCAHETYFDCPYYEQLMYVGDTRLEVLSHYAMQHDSRLPRKAVHLFDISRVPKGLTQCRYPSDSLSFIPPFSLWWVAMVHDLALWRGEIDQVRRTMPFCRSMLDFFLGHLNADGVFQAVEGWNFMDWVPTWSWGCPPDGECSVNSVQGWQLAHVLGLAAEVEEWLGEQDMAARWRRRAKQLAASLNKVFWDEGRGLFADNPSKSRWSEHSQCLAILSGQLDAPTAARVMDAMIRSEDLERTTIYFTHYYFEACRMLGRSDAMMSRLGLWFDLEKRGFKTTFEKPGDSRSDCHAWGAHPIYHYYATILGVRPSHMGFERVEIRPQLGGMKSAAGKLVHPRGRIEVDFHHENNQFDASVSLPDGIAGVFIHPGGEEKLEPGTTRLTIPWTTETTKL
ncbi:MAG: alpha-L-rhamnosidase C-terminal domain-containing protein [Verrucomicrobiae bacterium]